MRVGVAMVVLGLGILGCDDSVPDTSDSDAGGGGSDFGGSSGEGGTDSGGAGNGGNGGAELRIPSCLEELLVGCRVEGPCVVEEDGETTRTCFEDGMKRVATDGTECPQSSEVTVYNTDGSVCYSSTTTANQGQACEVVVTTWVDGSGATIASAHTSPTTDGRGYNRTYSCADGRPSTRCSSQAGPGSCANLVWPSPSPVQCEQGACEL